MNAVLHYDVKDLRGKVLLPAGTNVIDWSRNAIFSGEYLKKKSKLREIKFLMEDAATVFASEPYKKILQGWGQPFEAWVGEIWAPGTIVDELQQMKFQDPYSYHQVLVVALVGSRLLEIWIESKPTIKRGFQAFLTYNMGKQRLLPELHDKKETLTEAEKKTIHNQPLYSYVLNAHYWAECNSLSAQLALQHRENRLGTGYPLGTKTNSLILDVLSVVDRFHALTTMKPFKTKVLSPRKAVDYLKADADAGHLEPDVLKALVGLIRGEKLQVIKKIKLAKVAREITLTSPSQIKE